MAGLVLIVIGGIANAIANFDRTTSAKATGQQKALRGDIRLRHPKAIIFYQCVDEMICKMILEESNMQLTARLAAVLLAAFFIFGSAFQAAAEGGGSKAKGPFSVAAQYDTVHVYVAPDDFDKFVGSLIATFGGTKTPRHTLQATPTPSRAVSQLVMTPVGTFTVVSYTTPIPYPFGIELTGDLVTDLEGAVAAAKSHGAGIVVAPFPVPGGRNAIVEWPGGIAMEFYWHASPPEYPPLQSQPEMHFYVSAEHCDAFINGYKEFAEATAVADERAAPGVEIGRGAETYRRVRIESPFGKVTVIVTDGQLPYPYGRETAGFEVADFSDTLDKAEAAGATLLVKPYVANGRRIALLKFPGGFVAEIHTAQNKEK